MPLFIQVLFALPPNTHNLILDEDCHATTLIFLFLNSVFDLIRFDRCPPHFHWNPFQSSTQNPIFPIPKIKSSYKKSNHLLGFPIIDQFLPLKCFTFCFFSNPTTRSLRGKKEKGSLLDQRTRKVSSLLEKGFFGGWDLVQFLPSMILWGFSL